MAKSYIGDIPNPHVRDFQRRKLYRAEELCSFWNKLKILSLPKVKHLVQNITDWADVELPDVTYFRYKKGRQTYATATSLVLAFPIAKSAPFICHEMAHVINYQRGPADHHGPNFAKAYLEVVRQFMGTAEFKDLKYMFDTFGVKYKEVSPI